MIDYSLAQALLVDEQRTFIDVLAGLTGDQLEQSPKVFMLLLIARRTSDNQIARVIGATTRERYHMVNMPFSQKPMTIIAFTVLTIILCLYIVSGMRTGGMTPSMRSDSKMQPSIIDMGIIVTTILLSTPLFMVLMIPSTSLSMLLNISLAVSFVILPFLLFVLLRVTIRIRAFSSFLCIQSSTWLAFTVKSILSVFSGREKFSRCGVFIATFRTAFLGYTVHGKGHSLSSQGMYQHHSGTTIFGIVIIPQTRL